MNDKNDSRAFLVRWEVNVDACNARDAAEQARKLQADPDTWCQTFTVIDSVSEASTTIDLVNVDARLENAALDLGYETVAQAKASHDPEGALRDIEEHARKRKSIMYPAAFTYADIEALPYFAIVEGKQGQCPRGGVRGVDWDLFEAVRYDQEVCDELCITRGISLTDEEPERVNETAREGYDDLDAALDYLNEGGRLCKVPDTMAPDCADWALYVVR
jgi:hypothetical protein